MSCLYILKINPLSVALFANIFSHSEGCLFVLFMVSFVVQKLLINKLIFISEEAAVFRGLLVCYVSIINIMIIIFITSQKGYPNAIYGRDKNWLAWTC